MKIIVALAAALTSASASYVATLTHLDDDTLVPDATGYAFFDGVDPDTGVVTGFAQAKGMEADVDASNGKDCTAANGCGMHIHSGDACTNSTTQGGHYFDEDIYGDTDPWATVGYWATDDDGYTGAIPLSVGMGNLDIEGKPFIVHANDGSRVACGIIESTSLSHEEYLFLKN
jgi:Cu/Zn superoxide dismutase